MAETLSDFEFRRTRGSTATWDAFLDGRIHRLDEGVDFKSGVKQTQASIHQAGRRLGVKVKTQKLANEDGTHSIVVQAIPADAE